MRPMRKMTIVRAADAFLPVVFLIACLMGLNTRACLSLCAQLYAMVMAMRLCGLFTAESVRIAFATEPGMRDVQKSVNTALLMQVFSFVPCLGIGIYLLALDKIYLIWLSVCAFALNCEQIFHEYMRAEGDGTSAAISRCITAILVLAGIVLSADIQYTASFTDAVLAPLQLLAPMLICCGIAFLQSLIIAAIMSGGYAAGLNLQPIRRAPRAIAYALIYPTAAAILMAVLSAFRAEKLGFNTDAEALLCAYFIGLTVNRLFHSTFRRSRVECDGMKRATIVLLIVGAAAWIFALMTQLGGWFPNLNALIRALADICAMTLLSLLCAFATWGTF